MKGTGVVSDTSITPTTSQGVSKDILEDDYNSLTVSHNISAATVDTVATVAACSSYESAAVSELSIVCGHMHILGQQLH